MSKKEKEYLDIVNILSNPSNQTLISPCLKGKFLRKSLIFQSFIKGKITFNEGMENLRESLFIIMRPLLRFFNIKESKSDVIGRLIFNKLFDNYPLEPIKLFQYKLYYFPIMELGIREKYLSFLSTAEMIKEIAISNQYCVKEFIKDNATVIDVGANIGIFSLFVSGLVPNAKIYSFEPSPKSFPILKKNIDDNDLSSKIKIFKSGVGETEEIKEILLSSDVLGTSSIIEDSEFLKGREQLYTSSENVNIISLDLFIQRQNIRKVDFIKIDTEGYEKQVIKGARNIIKQFTPAIACAVYHLKKDKMEIPKLIKSINHNYVYREEKRAENTMIFWSKNDRQ